MIHHTWTDWDFSDANWDLYTGQYKSAPTSLRFTGAALTLNLCNLVDSICLPQGKLVTWHYFETGIYGILHFRNQEPAPDASFTNCYYVRLEENHIRLYRRVNNVDTILGNWTPLNEKNTGRVWTVTWWLYHAPYQDPIIRIRINGEAAGMAPPFEEQVDDPANQWAESETNRCGLAGLATAYHEYFDNTEIWLPTP